MTKNLVPEKEVDIRSVVRERYGSIAEKSKSDSIDPCCSSSSQSSCCDTTDADPDLLSKVEKMYQDPDVTDLPSDVTDISLGCGDPVTLASLKPGQTVLDLGSGGGIDCFLAAKKVGPGGKVIGVDMTAGMIEKARTNKEKIGAENVEFRLGEIEHLPVGDDRVDVIISNCVINLSPDKDQVFREAFRVLKSGGELAVSDIVTNGPLPDEIKNDLSAWAGCIGGALDVKDYIGAIESAGFVDVELVPSYWDQEVIDSALQQLDLNQITPAKGDKDSGLISIKEAGMDSNKIVIDDGETTQKFDAQKAIFSAKVKARKP